MVIEVCFVCMARPASKPAIAARAQRVRLVVHGHRHHRYGPVDIGGVPHLAHPFGYPRQHTGAEDGVRVISVDLL